MWAGLFHNLCVGQCEPILPQCIYVLLMMAMDNSSQCELHIVVVETYSVCTVGLGWFYTDFYVCICRYNYKPEGGLHWEKLAIFPGLWSTTECGDSSPKLFSHQVMNDLVSTCEYLLCSQVMKVDFLPLDILDKCMLKVFLILRTLLIHNIKWQSRSTNWHCELTFQSDVSGFTLTSCIP